MRYSAPSWESAIEAVFRAYLPAKFAIKGLHSLPDQFDPVALVPRPNIYQVLNAGRLDMHDLTQEGFFILRHNKKLFFILDDLLEVRASPAYPVYVANFDGNKICAEDRKSESESSVRSANPGKVSGPDTREEDANYFTLQKTTTGMKGGRSRA